MWEWPIKPEADKDERDVAMLAMVCCSALQALQTLRQARAIKHADFKQRNLAINVLA
jgi:hypothetical protein